MTAFDQQPQGPRRTEVASVPAADPALPDVLGRTAVFLHAHPDDEAIFTGAAMRRLADRGARVVLVTATRGEEGTSLRPLLRGQTLAARRTAELEHSCDVLGVARLILLGHRDSGMPGCPANRHAAAFLSADIGCIARQLAGLLEQEHAAVLVHYDSDGIYPHPDHLGVHTVGATAAALAGIPTYEATITNACLTRHPDHLLARGKPAHWHLGAGRTSTDVAVHASAAEWSAKRSAMAAHASQVPDDALREDGAAVYGTEWFLRSTSGLLG